MKKVKYEKPSCLDVGQIAAIQGAYCSTGAIASDGCRTGNGAPGGCVGGNDPQVAPVCQPGLDATYNCGSGTANDDGNCANGGTAYGVCGVGSVPQ